MQADVKHHADDRSNQQPEPTRPRHFTGEALPDASLCDPDRPKQPNDVGSIPTWFETFFLSRREFPLPYLFAEFPYGLGQPGR